MVLLKLFYWFPILLENSLSFVNLEILGLGRKKNLLQTKDFFFSDLPNTCLLSYLNVFTYLNKTIDKFSNF